MYFAAGPFSEQQCFCDALLAVEASSVTSADDQSSDDSAAGADKAREAAKNLLTKQRHNLGMWAAYAVVESQAGQHKVC